MGSNFSQLGNQLITVWKQLGANQRVSVILAALIVIGGLVGLSYWSSRADYALLYGKIDDAEAGKIVAALDDAKVPYRVRGSSIYVASDKVYQMRMQLAAKGIPKGDGVGFEIFDKANFGISDFVQRANYIRAVQGELARTISQLDEIEGARVMIVMPENRLLLDAQKKTTASVFVRLRGNGDLPASAVNSIRFLVANAVEGLQPGGVSIVDNRGNVLSANDDEDSVAGLSAGQLNNRRSIEQYLSQKAQSMLEKVLGPGQAVVRVSAEINTETVNRTEEKFDPDGQVAKVTTSTDENTNTTTPSSGGVAGVAGNTGGQSNAVASVTGSSTKRKTINNSYEINKTVSSTIQVAGGLKRVTAAVFVAAKSEGTGADRKTVPRTPEEIDKLKKIVQTALGLQLGAGALRGDEISLEEMPFNTDSVGVDVALQLNKQNSQAFWWEIGKNVGYGLLAIGILFVFMRMFKKASAESSAFGTAETEAVNTGSRAGVVTPEVLNRLIRENPANMNHAVRDWLKATPAQRN